MLNAFEESVLRQGRTFWEWLSPYGKQAIHYIEQGKGDEHVLLLHGFGAYNYTWRHQIPFLTREGYHVWALDYLGFGLSDKPSIPYTFDLFLALIRAFMQAKNILQAHIVGNSMGGSLTLGLAQSDPQKVRSLTLIDAVAYPFRLPFLVEMGRVGGKFLFPFISEMTVEIFLKKIVSNPQTITKEQVQAYLLPYHLKGGKEALLQMIKNFDFQTMMHLHQKLSFVTQPLLLLWGEDDRFIPLIQFYHLMQARTDAQSKLIAQAGHIPQEEQPDQVNENLHAFLKQVK